MKIKRADIGMDAARALLSAADLVDAGLDSDTALRVASERMGIGQAWATHAQAEAAAALRSHSDAGDLPRVMRAVAHVAPTPLRFFPGRLCAGLEWHDYADDGAWWHTRAETSTGAEYVAWVLSQPGRCTAALYALDVDTAQLVAEEQGPDFERIAERVATLTGCEGV